MVAKLEVRINDQNMTIMLCKIFVGFVMVGINRFSLNKILVHRLKAG